MPGLFMKGALIELMPTMLVPLPNVIVFQFNPETIHHSWTQPKAATGGGGPGSEPTDPLAVTGRPGESFSFTLVMDATDQLAEGNLLAKASGIYSRIAALEMLMYPTQTFANELIGSVSLSASASLSSGGLSASVEVSVTQAPTRPIPQSQVPVVLFVWGPGRIVPVRVTGLSIDEQLYDELLNPTHAEAKLELQVLTREELEKASGKIVGLAKTADTYSQTLRQVLALANLANSASSLQGMNPFF